ncbi:MAG: thiamine ABC transporter substrate-binding protein [Halodesulfurarchaeum sp.]
MKRRTFVRSVGAAGVAALAGCAGPADDTETTTTNGTTTGTTESSGMGGTLRVATYEPFVDAPSVSPGEWIKETFEKEYPEATLEYQTPDSELNYYVQEQQINGSTSADVYVGLNADDLVRVDKQLEEERLFEPIPSNELSNDGAVIDDLRFDPEGRAIPFDTGFISLVYDETEIAAPESFEDLLDPEYEDTLLFQDAQTSDPGRAFMLWTVANRGEDEYLEYWRGLVDNGAKILGDWNAAYTAYSNEERPAVVSYSTDQVYANWNDGDMSRHQIAFLNEEGYATPEGVARFADAEHPDLATAFVDFMLSAPVQSEIPIRNVSFPATTHADPPAEFEEFAHRPPETVTHSYDELAGSIDGWVTEWAEEIAGG